MRRRCLGAAAALLLVAASSACDASFGPGTGGCRVTVDNPHESDGTPGDIVGKGRILCDVAADNVILYVKLQRQTAARWADVVSGESPEIGPVEPGRRYTRQVVATCQEGTFRSAARGEGRLGGQPSGSVTWTYSREVTDPCRR